MAQIVLPTHSFAFAGCLPSREPADRESRFNGHAHIAKAKSAPGTAARSARYPVIREGPMTFGEFIASPLFLVGVAAALIVATVYTVGAPL
jgi:hypothetical protein